MTHIQPAPTNPEWAPTYLHQLHQLQGELCVGLIQTQPLIQDNVKVMAIPIRAERMKLIMI